MKNIYIIIFLILIIGCVKEESNKRKKECYIYKMFQNGIEIFERCNCYNFHLDEFSDERSRTIEINTRQRCGETNGKY